ncbi:hypothetical protein ACS0TY_021838 [Phlomoides rotata]
MIRALISWVVKGTKDHKGIMVKEGKGNSNLKANNHPIPRAISELRASRYNLPNYQSGQGNQAYNPNQRKFDNFSYANPKAAVPFPPGFEPSAKLPDNEGKATTDDVLGMLMKRMDAYEKKMETQMAQQYKNLEAQISQGNQ